MNLDRELHDGDNDSSLPPIRQIGDATAGKFGISEARDLALLKIATSG